MPPLRPLPTCASLLLLAILAGCASSPERHSRPHAARGGFSVLVDGPDHPASARVLTDIGTFAQRRGFVRQPAQPGPPVDPITGESLPAAPQRYARGSVEMEVSYQPTTHRVSAYLHGSSQDRNPRPIEAFYHDFDREYGPGYGREDPVSELGFADDSGPSTRERPPGDSVTGPGGTSGATEGRGRGGGGGGY